MCSQEARELFKIQQGALVLAATTQGALNSALPAPSLAGCRQSATALSTIAPKPPARLPCTEGVGMLPRGDASSASTSKPALASASTCQWQAWAHFSLPGQLLKP